MFFNKSVDSVLKVFNKALVDLELLKRQRDLQAESLRSKADKLNVQANDAVLEAAHAAAVAEKIKKLIEAV